MASSASVNGIEIAYEDEGSGEPLVLVHGHPFDRSLWAPQLEEFATAGYRVIVPDLRGYGHSGVLPGTMPWSLFAEDIAALLDHLGEPTATIGGVSMGGQITLEFYRLFPQRVRALILSDTSVYAESEAGKRWRHELADRLLREGLGGYTAEAIGKMVAPRHTEATARVRAMMLAAPPEGAAAALRARAERPDYTGLLTSITVPTLVVVGREDTYTPVRDAEFIRDRVPGAVLEVIEDCAHLPGVERPEEFNRVLRRFL
ncbi:alpha/beta fold hydrolase [Streptomyces gobiensis]|uniref:alpha/beta fold hydrolase n=1 Tax=Streptomyces gobiensis TaxID=2875706 RepID=UPI001E64D34E|nr:alpha/beta fold hydrolase [Streptomyces gobiensis]UGY94719.1 alpha/beta hydrolase [Streptomyces gobiensis]